DERLLHGMKVAVRREALDRLDLPSLARDGQGQAAVDGTAVDDDRARAAVAFVAHLLRAGEAERLTKSVEEAAMRRHVDGDIASVHVEGETRGSGSAELH